MNFGGAKESFFSVIPFFLLHPNCNEGHYAEANERQNAFQGPEFPVREPLRKQLHQRNEDKRAEGNAEDERLGQLKPRAIRGRRGSPTNGNSLLQKETHGIPHTIKLSNTPYSKKPEESQDFMKFAMKEGK